MQRGLVFRAYPTPEQAVQLAKTFGCCRVVYNTVLAEQERRFRARQPHLPYAATSVLLTRFKRCPERAWLREPSCVPLQQALHHLHHAYTSFFAGRANKPRFKRKNDEQSAEYTRSAFTYDERTRTLGLAKLGRLKVRWSRTLPRGVQPSTVTVRRDRAGRYFVSLRIDAPIAPLLPTDRTIGLDVGLAHLGSLPNGTHVDNPRHLTRVLRRLARAQRALARKQRGSRNRCKAQVRVARLHARVVDARADHLHKLSTALIRDNQAIGVERLVISNLLKNHALARGIADAGWGTLLRQLAYKARWYGRLLVEADRFFPSSKLCSTSGCGYRLARLDLATRAWTCPCCRVRHDRDTNAARNLEALARAVLARWQAEVVGLENDAPAAGLAVAACGGPVSPEPDASAVARPNETGTGRGP